MALMSGGTPDSNTNEPTKILALRAGATFWLGVDSESFGTPPPYCAYKIYASSSASMAVIDRSNLPLLDRARSWPQCGCNVMQGLSRLRKRQSNRTDGLTPDKSLPEKSNRLKYMDGFGVAQGLGTKLAFLLAGDSWLFACKAWQGRRLRLPRAVP
jgi:hypothetical protein